MQQEIRLDKYNNQSRHDKHEPTVIVSSFCYLTFVGFELGDADGDRLGLLVG